MVYVLIAYIPDITPVWNKACQIGQFLPASVDFSQQTPINIPNGVCSDLACRKCKTKLVLANEKSIVCLIPLVGFLQ